MSNESLKLSFELPAGLETCITQELNLAEEPNAIRDKDYVPKGSRLSIRCGDFYLDAVTPDFTPYEGMWPSSAFLSAEKLMENGYEGNYEHYSYGPEGSNAGLFLMDTFWGSDPGETYWVSTYIPTPEGSIYETARLGLRLEALPDYEDPDRQTKVEEYLKALLSKTANASNLEKLQAFEAILASVQAL